MSQPHLCILMVVSVSSWRATPSHKSSISNDGICSIWFMETSSHVRRSIPFHGSISYSSHGATFPIGLWKTRPFLNDLPMLWEGWRIPTQYVKSSNFCWFKSVFDDQNHLCPAKKNPWSFPERRTRSSMLFPLAHVSNCSILSGGR